MEYPLLWTSGLSSYRRMRYSRRERTVRGTSPRIIYASMLSIAAHARQRSLEVIGAEGREEAQRSHVEGHDGRHGQREEGGREEERSVASERDHEVHDLAQVVLLLLLTRLTERYFFSPRVQEVRLELLEHLRLHVHVDASLVQPRSNLKQHSRRIVVALLLHNHDSSGLLPGSPAQPHNAQRLVVRIHGGNYGRRTHNVLPCG